MPCSLVSLETVVMQALRHATAPHAAHLAGMTPPLLQTRDWSLEGEPRGGRRECHVEARAPKFSVARQRRAREDRVKEQTLVNIACTGSS